MPPFIVYGVALLSRMGPLLSRAFDALQVTAVRGCTLNAGFGVLKCLWGWNSPPCDLGASGFGHCQRFPRLGSDSGEGGGRGRGEEFLVGVAQVPFFFGDGKTSRQALQRPFFL